jgi:arginyl-tRNA synthetase
LSTLKLCFNIELRRYTKGDKFGHTKAAGGKKVIIEHTSSNPNAPLHIGNLRNVMIGAHLARMQAACGWEVNEAFYVNDLGAQIGLTVRRCRSNQ